jgi:hypothetical protein
MTTTNDEEFGIFVENSQVSSVDFIKIIKNCENCKETCQISVLDLENNLISVEICCKIITTSTVFCETVARETVGEETETVHPLETIQGKEEIDWDDDKDLDSFTTLSMGPATGSTAGHSAMVCTTASTTALTTTKSKSKSKIKGTKSYSIIWSKPIQKPKDYSHEQSLYSTYLQSDSTPQSQDEEYEIDMDKIFLKFHQTVQQNPTSIIRYSSIPTWVTKPEIKICCGLEMKFVFQILPVLYGILKVKVEFCSVFVVRCDGCGNVLSFVQVV